MTRLQIAVDGLPFEGVIAVAGAVHETVDIFEVGTPVILREGLRVVRRVKERYPNLTVLADTKIVDGGSAECTDACEAGADIVTVLGVSDDATIRGVVDTARRYGRKTMADLLCVQNPVPRAKELIALGADYICVHTPVDAQMRGASPLGEFETLLREVSPDKVAVAGGIHQANLREYLKGAPAIIIMGSALCNAPDLRQAALQAKRLVAKGEGK